MVELAAFYDQFEVPLLIFALGVLTYITRFGGYVFFFEGYSYDQ